jgi:hypothetical protein
MLLSPQPSQQLGGSALAIALTGVVIAGCAVSVIDGGWRPLSPVAVLLYCHAVVFVLHPWYVWTIAGGRNIFDGSLASAIDVYISSVACLGLLSAVLGYGLACWNTRREKRPEGDLHALPASEWHALRPGLILLAVVGLALFALNIAQIGLAQYLSFLTTGRSSAFNVALQTGSGYLQSGLLFLVGLALLVLLQGLLSRRRGLTALGVVLLVVFLVPDIAAGSRSVFVPILIAVLVYVHAARPHAFTPLRVVVLAPVVYIGAFIAPRVYRVELAQGGDLLDAVAQSVAPQNLVADFLGGYDTAMYDAFTLQVRAQAAGALQQAHGATYAGALASVVPRQLWNDKPASVDQVLNAALLPATNAKRIGFSFGLYSEPYFNFGLAGVVVVLLAFGMLLGMLDRMLARKGALGLLAAGMITGGLFTVVRGSISFDSQRTLIMLLPVLLVTSVVLARRSPGSGIAPPAVRRR